MTATRLKSLCLLPLLLAMTAVGIGAEDAETGLPVLESGAAAVDLGTRRLTVRYAVTVAGTLVEVRPLIDVLGGTVEVGPLGESHELTLNDRTFAFGPGSDALTSGQEITDLSQAAIATGDGATLVPLDLLDYVWGHNLGYEFTWNSAARMLLVRHQPERELALQFNLVHVQGVTTTVFQFSTRPRYRIRHFGRSVVIDLIGDRLVGDTTRSAPADDLVRGIDLTPSGIRMRLAPGVVAEEYILESPFRLVFDIFRGDDRGTATAATQIPARRRDRSPGIRTIVLDPGHGGTDTGAVGPGGLEEKRLTLQLARTTQSLLESRLPVRVVLTRTGDATLPLETRAALANQNKGDLFLSLHFNSAVGSRMGGAEAYSLSNDPGAADAEALAAAAQSVGGEGGDPLFDLELQLWDRAQSGHLSGSRALASLIQEELNSALELGDRRARRAPLRVLAGAAMPAVLVELGYLTNPDEESRLEDPAYRLTLADALVKAVTRYRARAQGVEAPTEGPTP